MMDAVRSHPDILGGMPCFAGTRVPVETLFDHLQRGYTVEGYLRQFPSVGRDVVGVVLVEAARLIAEQAAQSR